VLVLLLFVAGLALLFFELFVPGGILGTMGIVCVGASIFFAFKNYEEIAMMVLAGELLALGVGVVIAVRIFPHTPIARRLTLTREFDAQEGFTSASSESDTYVGKEGVALTTLRPAGIALIEGKRINVVTDGEFIERDARVRVSEVEGSRIVVHAISEEEDQAQA
jgi:membrane-bound ClpP family serine protease